MTMTCALTLSCLLAMTMLAPMLGWAATPSAGCGKTADCRTYCGRSTPGWSGGSAGSGWPKVLDCRAVMGHTYSFSWTWKLILDFFDAHSR
jgi:hypothetical protein